MTDFEAKTERLEHEVAQLKKRLRDRDREDAILAASFSSNPDAITVIDVSSNQVLVVNHATSELLGYTPAEMIGREPDAQNLWVSKTDRNNFSTWLRDKSPGEFFETRLRRKNGTEFDAWITGDLLVYSKQILSVSTIRDISDLAEARRMLATRNQELMAFANRLTVAQETARLGDFEWDLEARMLTVSEILSQLMGVPVRQADVGLSYMATLVHADDMHKFSVAEDVYDFDFRPRVPVDGVEWLRIIALIERNAEGRAIRISGTIQDHTSRVKAAAEQEALRMRMVQSQKLESLGVLAGGIAHDFNNLLTSILGNAELLKRIPLLEQEGAGKFAEIELAVRRAEQLTGQLLAYSGKGRQCLVDIDLSATVRSIAPLLSGSIGKSVLLQLDLGLHLPVTTGDRNQLQQVVMNLVINASEAIDGGGEIRLATGVTNTALDTTYFQLIEGDRFDGEQVYLEVYDSGKGMEQAILQRLFEPFFSTKFLGRGLGMSAVVGIVRSHGGMIGVRSSPGEGTSVRVQFPVTGVSAQSEGHNLQASA